MMGTNDTGYINKVAIGGHIALDTVLLISYVVELLKGSRTLSYFLVVAAFMIIPIAVELAIYSKKKDAASIRHILAITYGVFYLFAIFTTNSISTFVYILPFFIYADSSISRRARKLRIPSRDKNCATFSCSMSVILSIALMICRYAGARAPGAYSAILSSASINIGVLWKAGVF